ncbi:MAG: hypothetical protein GYA24_05600 [Candidatus Lokiarchaeota archaeon]|nr:hypothetical protein [Candidatus Lokiarchaeota archaeon]
MIAADARLAQLAAYPRLPAGNPFLDGLLGGGLLHDILHVVAGPGRWTARLLEALAVSAQAPAGKGGAGCTRVAYVLCDNRFDPYHCTQVARAAGLDPGAALDCIAIARGFNWDQVVEACTRLPGQVAPGTLVVVSGLTDPFDPAGKANFDGLREALHAIGRCFEHEPVYAIASAPVAQGSTFKPRGGHLLYHAAGCIVTVTREDLSATTQAMRYHLVKHPLKGEATATQAIVSPSRKVKKGQDALRSFRTLDDFGTRGE